MKDIQPLQHVSIYPKIELPVAVFTLLCSRTRRGSTPDKYRAMLHELPLLSGRSICLLRSSTSKSLTRSPILTSYESLPCVVDFTRWSTNVLRLFRPRRSVCRTIFIEGCSATETDAPSRNLRSCRCWHGSVTQAPTGGVGRQGEEREQELTKVCLQILVSPASDVEQHKKCGPNDQEAEGGGMPKGASDPLLVEPRLLL